MCGPETPNIHLQELDTIKNNLILFTGFHLLLKKCILSLWSLEL